LATKRPPDPTPIKARSTPTSAVDGTLPTILLKQATESAAARTAILEPVQQSDALPKRGSGSGSGIAAFFAGAALAAASLLLAVFAAPIIGIGAPPAAAPPRTVIADAFMAGPQSPRGEIATNIDRPTALRLADYNLHGVDRAIDRAEAEFWLKKAMSLTASHTQLRWAVTQLGTLAAQPVTGSPDYDKARLLWEISAGNGDPIALCFLGTLAENGLGGPADRAKALEYYKRSKEIGGCPSTDEAITRLSK
jgi:TPR repeat protein